MLKIKLYCILRNRADLSLEEQAEQCCLGEADALLLADGTLSPKETVARAENIRKITRKSKVLFFVGSRPDIAAGVDVDGVHLGPDDVSVELTRQLIGPVKVVGCAVSSMGQALAAAEAGAGYVMAGPMYSQGKTPLGMDIIRLIKKRVKIPVLACGGIKLENVEEIIMAGADGIAVSGAVCGAASVREAARVFKAKILEQALKENSSGVIHNDTR